MMLLSFMIQHYFSLKYEDFTGKIISAYAILKTIDETSNEDIEKIIKFSFRNNTMQIKQLLNELPELKEDTLRKDIEELTQKIHKNNMISICEIKKILNKEKLKDGRKSESEE